MGAKPRCMCRKIPRHAVACRLQAAVAMISKDACESWNTMSLFASIDENTYDETKSCLTGNSAGPTVHGLPSV
jgi:hypothetical protein